MADDMDAIAQHLLAQLDAHDRQAWAEIHRRRRQLDYMLRDIRLVLQIDMAVFYAASPWPDTLLQYYIIGASGLAGSERRIWPGWGPDWDSLGKRR